MASTVDMAQVLSSRDSRYDEHDEHDEHVLEDAFGSNARSILSTSSMSACSMTRELYPLIPPPSKQRTDVLAHELLGGKGLGKGLSPKALHDLRSFGSSVKSKWNFYSYAIILQ